MIPARRLRAWSLSTAVLATVFLAAPDAPAGRAGRSDECRGGRGPADSCGKGPERRSADVIFVSHWARHARAVELLRGLHPLRPLGRTLGHVIVTPEDLETASVRTFLREAYAAGYVVAVTSAREDHARLLASLVGTTGSIYLHARAAPEDPGAPGPAGLIVDAELADDLAGALVLLRRHDEDGGGGHRIHSLWAEAAASSASGRAGRAWLSARFQTGEPTPGLGSSQVCADPNTCLQNISQGKIFEAHTTDPGGDSISIQNEIYSTRSFSQALDYYFVNQTGAYDLHNPGASTYNKMRTVEGNGAPSGAFVVDVAPATTTCTDTLITSVTETVGSSIGVSSTKGGTTFSGGVQYGTQNRLNCSNLVVVNRSSDTSAEFERDTSGLPQAGDFGSSIANQFVYVVPLADEAKEVGFETRADLTGCESCSGFPNPQLTLVVAASNQTLDFPFPTKTPVAPKISSVTPSTTPAGGIVTIAGEGFYANALAALTINGVAVPTANILPPTGSVPADQQILLLMPSAGIPVNTPLPVVVHTVFGISNDDQTITLQ